MRAGDRVEMPVPVVGTGGRRGGSKVRALLGLIAQIVRNLAVIT
jgi:hypothetical protein